MFTGFSEETIQFFLDLKFHNNTEYFHQEHDRYVETVQKPFYAMIEALAPLMRSIDPSMELRPHKCLSRIHRDTRFSRDKSPYRDHLWFLFRKAAEPREGSLFYYFEFGVDKLSWGMGFWGENRPVMDHFRNILIARPEEIAGVTDAFMRNRRGLYLGGSAHKRMAVPATLPERLKRWYLCRELYIGKAEIPYAMAFSEDLLPEVEKDFRTIAPVYKMFRHMADETED